VVLYGCEVFYVVEECVKGCFLFVIDVGVCLFVQFAVFGWVMFVVLFLV